MDKGKNIMTSGHCSNGVLDHSKIRILLLDTNVETCQETFTLLTKCSYQVTPAFSATDVLGVLNSDDPHTAIIHAEANVLMTKGWTMLKYIKRDKVFKHIPVIMMLTEDEVSLVLKGLGLGATDYLMKPLDADELMNLWSYMH